MRRRMTTRCLREAELLDPVAHLVAVDAEQLRRLGLVAAGALERLHEQLPLDLLEVDAFGRQPELGRRHAARQREVLRLELAAVDQQHRALDGVAQLADVAGPLVLLERAHGCRRQAAQLLRNSRLNRSM